MEWEHGLALGNVSITITIKGMRSKEYVADLRLTYACGALLNLMGNAHMQARRICS